MQHAKRILLVNPPQNNRYPQPPPGLAMIAAVLEGSEHQVGILDLQTFDLSEKAISKVIAEEAPNIVGITALTPTINSAIGVAKKVKQIDEDVTVVLGGPHGTILPEETLLFAPEIDIIVRGEGEQTMLEVAGASKERTAALKGISGITYRENNEIRSTSPRVPISNLDKLPFPAFHLLPMKRYRLHPPFGRKSPAIPIITSRGCPYRCSFCSKSVFGKRYRSNTASYVIREIQLLKEKFGVKEIKFYDDVFTIDRKRVIEICRLIKEQGIDILWTCETRVNLVDEEMLGIMSDAGCYMIAYGVESGNQRVLENLKKDITLEQAVRAFKLTKRLGIETAAYFMLGSPGETSDTVWDTIEFAKTLDPDFVQFSTATPFPGTEYYAGLVEEGKLPKEWDKYVYADLRHLDNVIFETKLFDKSEMKKWSKKAYSSFYLRHSYLWKRLKRIRSVAELKANIAGLCMFLETML